MAKYQHCLFLIGFLCLTFFSTGICHTIEGDSKKKLFVFGDSYVDTGNSIFPGVGALNEPYGITFPGKPTGRFSDGRILTDYIASFFGVHTPVPYEKRMGAKNSQIRSGMNFAHGGSGVFSNAFNPISLSTQIDYFKKLIDDKWYTQTDLNSSVAVVHTSGNDYAVFMMKPHSPREIEIFREKVIKELARGLKTIYDLGVHKVTVLKMVPAGCTPENADKNLSFPENCNQALNKGAQVHNQALKLAVEGLNKEAKREVFVVLDLYNAFLSAMNKHARTTEDLRYKNPTTACCKGTSPMACGMVEKITGTKMYTLCDHPEMSFFFDIVHPTQHASQLVYKALKDSLEQLLS